MRRRKALERYISPSQIPAFHAKVVNLLTVLQMAKRMDFSVVGLPHYTIWHLYEPSVDDIRHMEVRAL